MKPDLIEELRDGLEGVTPGPWRMSVPDRGYCSNYILTDAPELAPTESQPWKHLIADFDDCARGEVNAAHIARCSPDNIRTLLDSLASKDTALSDAADRIDSLKETVLSYSQVISEKQRRADAAESELVLVKKALADIELELTLADGVSRGYDLKPALAKIRSISQDGEER